MSREGSVLVIEDDQLWRERLAAGLSNAGLSVTAFSNWIDSIRYLRDGEEKVACVVADLSVGSSVDYGVNSLRYLSNSAAPPTLVLTSAYMDPIVRKCFSMSFVSDVVPKANIADIEAALTKLTGKSVMLRERRMLRVEVEAMKTRTVFVVHGRDAISRRKVFGFLRSLGLRPLEWEEAVMLCGKASPYIGEVIDAGMAHSQAIVVLLTGDDEVRLSGELASEHDEAETSLRRQPRANVLFEAGFSLARYPNSTIFAVIGDVKLFSDIHGRHLLRLSGAVEDRNTFVGRLRVAGCDLSTSGSDWLQVEL